MLAATPHEPLPSGFGIRYFDAVTHTWIDVDRVTAEGSYRFDCYRPEYRVISRNVAKRVTQPVAIYHAIARQGASVLQYDLAHHHIRLPMRCRLPGLYSRALVLSSGLLPAYEHETAALHYSLISPALYKEIAKKLIDLEENSCE
jgi:hypothetical protein